GRLKLAGEQVFLLDRLRRMAWVNARRPEELEFFYAIAVSGMDDVGLDGQVLVEKIGRKGAVGEHASDFRGCHEHVFRSVPGEECVDGLAVAQVQLGVAFQDEVLVIASLEIPMNSRANQPPMAGDEDTACLVHALYQRITVGAA